MLCFSAFVRLLLIALLGIPAGACAATGLPDLSYGSAGYARLSGTTGVGPQAIVQRANGSTVFAASRPTTSRDIIVAALSADGHPDGTFAGGGLLQITTSGTLYRPVLYRDSRSNTTLLAASDYRGGAYRLLLCRILDDGTLDQGFTTAGYTSQTGCISLNPPAFAPSGTLPAGLAVLGSGNILVGGSAYDFGNNAFRAFYAEIAPFNVNPNGGASITAVPSVSSVFVNAVVVDPVTADIYYTGFQRPGADPSLIVFKLGASSVTSYLYNPNLVANGLEDGRALAVRNSNEIYVAGVVETSGGKSECVLVRLDGSLQPVSSFGPLGNGRRALRFNGGSGDSASCDALQADGQGLTVGGRVGSNNDQFYELAAARLSLSGDYDAGFGNQGITRINPGLNPLRSERALALGVHKGRVLLAGPSDLASNGTPQTADMIVVRLGGADVLFDNGFN